jgi:phosphate starvation-inducible protein PhoH and related proteins
VPGELRDKIILDDNSYAGRLYGPGNHNLKRIAAELGIELGARGNEISITAETPGAIKLCKRIIEEMYSLVKRNYPLNASDVERAILILRSDESQTLAPIFLDTVFTSSRGKSFGPKGLAQKQYLDAIKANDIVFGIGPAGSGKTFLAMAAAVAALTRKEVKRIVLCRPAVEAGEKLGFLPGDLAEKVNPYLRPLYDALNDMLDAERAKGLIDDGVIEIAPLAFMRGRTINNSFIILDEAQNTTPEQMKMFLTRLGYDSKAVVTGDITQIDLPTSQRSGLLEVQDILRGVNGLQFCYFSAVDVVRHPVVQEIVRAYERSDALKPPKPNRIDRRFERPPESPEPEKAP